MPIAEVAESLFAAINADAIIGCGSAIKEISSLYGTLGSTIDTAHQQLFTGDTTWSGTAASNAKSTMTDLNVSSSSIQSALSTIGDTLVAYGTALKPFQGKVYPTPVPGSRDPEAAADLAITGTASAAAALEVGAAALKMMPIAKQGTSSSAKPGTPAKPGKPGTPAHSDTADDGTNLASSLNPAQLLSGLTNHPALTGLALPAPGNGMPALSPALPGAGGFIGISPAGVIGPAEEAAAIQASEAAAMHEGMPLMPMMPAGNRSEESERNRTITQTEDPEFWTAQIA